jgi:hypothetical protein
MKSLARFNQAIKENCCFAFLKVNLLKKKKKKTISKYLFDQDTISSSASTPSRNNASF